MLIRPPEHQLRKALPANPQKRSSDSSAITCLGLTKGPRAWPNRQDLDDVSGHLQRAGSAWEVRPPPAYTTYNVTVFFRKENSQEICKADLQGSLTLEHGRPSNATMPPILSESSMPDCPVELTQKGFSQAQVECVLRRIKSPLC